MIFRLHCAAARLHLGVIFCLILTAGCGPQQAVKPATPAPPPSAGADSKLGRGDFLGAAAEYERLSQIDDVAQSSRHRVMAALAYTDGGDRERARSLLSDPSPIAANAEQIFALALAASDSFASGTQQAARQLESVDSRKLTPYQRNVYYRTSGRIAAMNRDYPSAASAYIAADGYALPAEMRAKLHGDIWSALSHMDGDEINAATVNALRRERAWFELASAAGPNLHNSAALAAAIEAWIANHPQHPANITLVEQLFELSESLSSRTRHVALLLPFHGPFANAASAIRDGFLSAWYAHPTSANRPVVSVYSVDAATVNSVYDRAVSNGADLIVGPLEKSTVEALIARTDLPVRTLALNVADDFGVAGSEDDPIDAALFFQFGLTPEDEAAAAAEKAWADGHSRVVAMGPESPWGTRVVTAFSARWQELGGVLLTQATYGDTETAYSRAVKQALNVDLSEARAAALRRALNRTIGFEPRRRTDVEVVFLAGFPLGARQVLPQLRYFRAESVPVYSTSHVYSGRANPAADLDLDGLRFGDMPWLFAAADNDTFNMFNENWPERAAGSGRLFAFGLDAYRILPYLARMRHQPGLRIPGATGVLHMDDRGRVIRALAWARFSGGVPTLIDQ
jgi:outer membrane PBP1 activator LpoA protein